MADATLHIASDAGDFFSIKSGRALHDSIAVRGWRVWEGER